MGILENTCRKQLNYLTIEDIHFPNHGIILEGAYNHTYFIKK